MTTDGRIAKGERRSPATEFKPRERRSVATEIRPGERRSIGTEFRPGQPAHNHLPVGSVTIRIESTTGCPRAWIKVAEPNVWRKRATVAWEKANGRKLPRGLLVHHKDHDAMNDDPSNLVALTRKEHAAEHRDDLYEQRRAR